jgi:hypothetical protein
MVCLALLAAMLVVAPPARSDADAVFAIGECMTPAAGSTGTGPGSTWVVLFGWEIDQPDTTTPVVIPPGPKNRITGGTLVSGPLPTEFSRPIVNADGKPAHAVWPPFVYNPPGQLRGAGRTQWWADAPVAVQGTWGQTVGWSLGRKNSTLTIGSGTQRCSQHVFLEKTWNGAAEPPASIDWQRYELRMWMTAGNPAEPNVKNTGVSSCRYQKLSENTALPYGKAFKEPAEFSPQLKCVYTNKLPYSSDQDGYWIPRGGQYTVDEIGMPAGWFPGRGVGASQVIDFTNPATVAQCRYYPAFGTSAARPDSDGSTIPQLGRASNKWCLQPVENFSTPASVSVTKQVEPATSAGWSFNVTISPAPPANSPTPQATLTATSQNPTVTWQGLLPDVEYTVTEQPVDGFESGPVVCPGGGATVRPTPQQTPACFVTNRDLDPAAQLSVTKTVTGDGAPSDWGFEFTITPAPANGSPDTITATAANPVVIFTGLQPGQEYRVVEAPAEGYEASPIVCGPGGGAAAVAVAGDVTECTVQNRYVAPPVGGGTTSPTPTPGPEDGGGSIIPGLPTTGAVVLGGGVLLAAALLLIFGGGLVTGSRAMGKGKSPEDPQE